MFFSKVRCFYCNNWNQRPKTTKAQRLKEFQCKHCTAVNFLDDKGRITDPPLERIVTSTPQPVRYGHATRSSSQEPPSPSRIFCNTCLQNQFMLYENKRQLDAVEETEDPKKYRQQQEYIRGLEQRYPQVCEQCRPKARAAIKQANYFTRAWNMAISMRKTKSGEYAPVIEGRWWRNWLLKAGQIGREGSILGQAAWHLLGARMVPNDYFDPASGVEPPANVESTLGQLAVCTSQTLTFQPVNPHCFEEATKWIPYLLIAALMTLWWNNMLRQKFLDRKPGRMVGLADYYILQAASFAIRCVAFYALPSPHRFAWSSGIEQLSGINKMFSVAHWLMLAIIGFMELITRFQVRLDNRYKIRSMRDEDILPDEPMPARVDQNGSPAPVAHYTRSQQQPPPPAWLRKDPKPFNISSLSTWLNAQSNPASRAPPPFPQPQYNAPAAPPTPPLEDSMEWSPTVTSFASSSFQSDRGANSGHDLRPRNSVQRSQQLSGPSPFAKLPPQAPPNRMTHPRAPVQQSSFFKSSRPTPADRDTSPFADTRTQTDRPWSKSGNDMNMSNPSFFIEKDKIDTGLETAFGNFFSIDDNTPKAKKQQQQQSQKMRRDPSSSSDGSPSRGHGALFGAAYEDPSVQQPDERPSNLPDLGVFVLIAMLAGIVGAAWWVVKNELPLLNRRIEWTEN